VTEEQQLTKKQRQVLKRQQKLEAREQAVRKTRTKDKFWWFFWGVIAVVVIAIIVLPIGDSSKSGPSNGNDTPVVEADVTLVEELDAGMNAAGHGETIDLSDFDVVVPAPGEPEEVVEDEGMDHNEASMVENSN